MFFDADNDGDQDLYAVSGSNEFENEKLYQDRLYINDGKGNFKRTMDALPTISSSGLAVDYGDFDLDGDLDLVVGGRVVPGQYPTPPRSYLLENTGGKFKDVTALAAPELLKLGMITALEFSDFDHDHDLDLVAVGEWMPVTILKNIGGKFETITEDIGLSHTSGWWFSLISADIDHDGDIDYVAGNIGKNNKYKPTKENPLHIYYSDFDNNGTGDIVLSKMEEAIPYPIRGRECTSQQMPFVADKFPDYKSFSSASLMDIYSEPQLADALHYEAYEFGSCVLINDGNGKFTVSLLPAMAQISPLTSIRLIDLNADHALDIVAAGNFFGTETETIRYDAGSGLCLLGDGKGNFSHMPVNESGLYVDGDVKDLEVIQLAYETLGLLVAN